jgi:hypothetical protein
MHAFYPGVLMYILYKILNARNIKKKKEDDDEDDELSTYMY